MGNTQKVGALGEELVVKFLVKSGYKILDRNFRKPWGELDIVAEKKGKIHFVEVKRVTHEISSSGTKSPSAIESDVTHETLNHRSNPHIPSGTLKDRYRPEDNLHSNKIRRLGRIIQTYLSRKHVSSETDWQFDVATVLLDTQKKKAKIDFIEDVTLEALL